MHDPGVVPVDDFPQDPFTVDTDDDDEPDNTPARPAQVSSPEASERAGWERLDLNEKCDEVMNHLIRGDRRWDISSPEKTTVPVLEPYKKESLTMKDPRDPKSSTALHILARHFEKKYSKIPEDSLSEVLVYLLDRRDKGLFGAGLPGQVQEEPILNVALEYDNDRFIDHVKNFWPLRFPGLLSIQDKEGKNFLHRLFFLPEEASRSTILKDYRKKAFERARKYALDADARTLAARDKEGNTPIHYAVEYPQCFKRNEEYIRIVQNMVLNADSVMKDKGAFNNRDESPILYCQRTRKEYEEWKQEWEQGRAQRNAASAQQANSRQAEPESGATITTAATATTTSKALQSTFVGPVPKSKAKYRSMGDGDIPGNGMLSPGLDAPEGFGFRRSPTGGRSGQARSNKPDAIQVIQPNERLAAHPPKTPAPPNAKKGGDDSADKILEFLQLHYIRTRSDLEARDLMYGKDVSDKNLYFDASGHKNAEEVIKLIDRMSIGGFGDTLAYVYLPIVQHSQDSELSTAKPANKKSYTMNKSVARQNNALAAAENPKVGRTSLVRVFDKLYEAGVKRILRLQVDDWESLSHTDAALEMAVHGSDRLPTGAGRGEISIETWDWRKPDLSLDVIAFAAPGVEHVNLYWSGNQAVLRGWASSEGIPRLYNLNTGKPKTITIHAAPGIESRKRMDWMLDIFNKQIDAFNKQLGKEGAGIEVKVKHRMSGLIPKPDSSEDAGDSGGRKAEGERQHIWVKRMEEFRRALTSFLGESPCPTADKIEKVKVALIDDGVDLSNLDSYNDVVTVTGLSYYPPDGKGERPWHRSSHGHGTIMANMIRRINPWVSLHVMKLQDGLSSDGSRTIFAESAAKAIRGAIHRKVDIISMSWTVKQKITSSISASMSPRPASRPAAENNNTRTTLEATAITMLEDAIDAAVNAGILLFCSASDDIQAGGMDSLPFRRAPTAIFRIGAALSQGQRDPRSEDNGRIEYFFPGNQVAEAWNPRSAETVKYHDGSSVSTALAAGLASLIIYCAIIVRDCYAHLSSSSPLREESQELKRFQRFATGLRNRENMKRALDSIEHEGWEDRKFLPVWGPFGKAADDISTPGISGKEKLQHLDKLVVGLCGKFTDA